VLRTERPEVFFHPAVGFGCREPCFLRTASVRKHDSDLFIYIYSWERIACSAMSHADDGPTLGYLANCAQRMREGRATGYCLPGQGTEPAHFLWVDLYVGFTLAEIDSGLESSGPQRRHAV
jgi:hypothetical protein